MTTEKRTVRTAERIRDTMLDAGRQARYYQRVSNRFQGVHFALSMGSIVGSLAAATTLLSPLGDPYIKYLSASFFFLVAGITAWMIVYDYSRRAQIARTASERLKQVEVKLQRLWYLDQGESTIHTNLEQLEGTIDEITRDDILIDDKLNKRCNQEAWDVIESFYPSPTGPTSADTPKAP